ncbi:MAG: citrate synthase [Myxococcota bacterium]
MEAGSETTRNGLEGVVVAETRLSRVDGERGRLVVCGRDIEALVREVRFEGVCSLLWSGELAGQRALEIELGRARAEAWRRLPELGDALEKADGMEALRAALAHLPTSDPADDAASEAARLTGACAVFLAAWARGRLQGRPPIAPDPARPHAEDLLCMLGFEAPEPARVAALDAYMTTVAEHGMNASTFAARVVASTGSDSVSAVVAAVGALKGPRHGGVPGPVLEMFDAIGEARHARSWLEAELDAGRRIMGMGHRVYRVRDPRAAVFEAAVGRLAVAGIASDRLGFARCVEREAVAALAARYPERRLEANVEFYTAVLLDAAGLHRAAFTPLFACARVAGWLAHVEEQRRTGRLIRPKARYVGPLPEAA